MLGRTPHRRRIVEVLTDDYRDQQALLIAINDHSVISLLKIPERLAGTVTPGELYDLSGVVVDRDTEFSPEMILVQGLSPTSGRTGTTAESGHKSSIPSAIQDPWYRPHKENVAVLLRLLDLPPDKIGSLTAAVLRSTARALVWLSASRMALFAEIGEEALYNLAAIANSKGHTPEAWLGGRLQMVRDVIAPEISPSVEQTPEAEIGASVVERVVRQQEMGIRAPGPTRGSAGGTGHAGHRSEGRAIGSGGGHGGAAPDVPQAAEQPKSMHQLVDAISSPDWRRDHATDEGMADINPEPHNVPEQPSPDEDLLAAFDELEFGPERPAREKPTSSQAGQRKKKSSPSMGGLSFGSGKKKRIGNPKVR